MSLCLRHQLSPALRIGGDDGENTDTRDGSEGIESEETAAAENALELPAELDYGGENIIIYGYDLYPKEHLAEELNGELVNDAVFNRNKNVEELLNVNISVVINPLGQRRLPQEDTVHFDGR